MSDPSQVSSNPLSVAIQCMVLVDSLLRELKFSEDSTMRHNLANAIALVKQSTVEPQPSASNPLSDEQESRAREIILDCRQMPHWAARQIVRLGDRVAELERATVEPKTECSRCRGSGEVKAMTQEHGPDDYEFDAECPDCKGVGVVDRATVPPKALPTRVRLTMNVYDHGQDHHPPGYCGRKGDVVEVRSVESLAVAHEGREGGFIVHRHEFEAVTTEPPSVESFQDRVRPWLWECFGKEVAENRTERNHRFIEEALELVQACGCTQEHAHQIVDYVYGRPAGDPFQEVGGVMVTLAALCLAQMISVDAAAEAELARIWKKIDVIREKQARKVKDSALPGSSVTKSEE